MQIYKQWLIRRQVCEKGLEWYGRKVKAGELRPFEDHKKVIDLLKQEGRYSWAAWIVQRLLRKDHDCGYDFFTEQVMLHGFFAAEKSFFAYVYRKLELQEAENPSKPMISVEWLWEHSACAEGREWFKFQVSTGKFTPEVDLDKLVRELSKFHIGYYWVLWLARKILNRKNRRASDFFCTEITLYRKPRVSEVDNPEGTYHSIVAHALRLCELQEQEEQNVFNSD